VIERRGEDVDEEKRVVRRERSEVGSVEEKLLRFLEDDTDDDVARGWASVRVERRVADSKDQGIVRGMS
jgi:hypothetical protein